jgi:hypothetical protein
MEAERSKNDGNQACQKGDISYFRIHKGGLLIKLSKKEAN